MDRSILTQEQNGYRLPENERWELLSEADDPSGIITKKMRAETDLQRKKFIAWPGSGNSLEL